MSAIAKKTSRKEYVKRIKGFLGDAVASFIDAGKELIEAKDDLEHGEFKEMVDQDLGISSRMAQMLMKVARHPVLSNAKHVSLLPPSWGTLYELAKVDDALLEAKIKDGTINPRMERKDVKGLLIKAGAKGEEREEVEDPNPQSATNTEEAQLRPVARDADFASSEAEDANPHDDEQEEAEPTKTPRRVPDPTGKHPDGIPAKQAKQVSPPPPTPAVFVPPSNLEEATKRLMELEQRVYPNFKIDGTPGLRCSFCLKFARDVRRMIFSHEVAICNECVALCADIISAKDEEDAKEVAEKIAKKAAKKAAKNTAKKATNKVPEEAAEEVVEEVVEEVAKGVVPDPPPRMTIEQQLAVFDEVTKH